MRPLKIKIKDFFAISDAEIDFTKFSSALILGRYENNVLMSNGAGKSSLLEAICWVIFNKTRQAKIDDIIRWQSSEVIVAFDFEFNGSVYRIYRKRSRVSKEGTVSFFTKEGEIWKNDSGSTNSETNDKILLLLNIDLDIFINSVYFKQHDISMFADASSLNRKEIITSIMNLGKWDEYQKQAKNKLKLIKEDSDKQLRIIQDNNDLSTKEASNKKSLIKVNEVLKMLENNQKNIQNKLYSLLEIKKERNLNVLLSNLNILNRNISSLKNEGKLLQNKRKKIFDLLNSNIDLLNQCNDELIKLQSDINSLNINIGLIVKYNIDYEVLEEDILLLRVTKNESLNIINDLDRTEACVGIGECQLCLTKITNENIEYIHNNRNEKRIAKQAEYLIILYKLSDLENEYKIRRANNVKLKDFKNTLNYYYTGLANLNKNRESLILEQKKLDEESAILSASMRMIFDQLQSFKIENDALEHNIEAQKINNVELEILNIETKHKQLLSDIALKNIDLGVLYNERDVINNKLVAYNKATNSLIKLNKDKATTEQLIRFFGKEGIQAVFIESVIGELEQYANDTLAHICNEPTLIRLKTQKKVGDSWQETLEIDVLMNGFHQTFESLGGGERFRISLALRIGLSEVLAKRSGGEIKLLLLDEVDSPLDAYGLNNLFEGIIKGLEKRFKILIISHNDKLIERFDNIIVVNKTSNGSVILQN